MIDANTEFQMLRFFGLGFQRNTQISLSQGFWVLAFLISKKTLFSIR